MPTVGIRELARNTARVIEDAQRTRRPYIITRNGEPVVVLYAIDPDALEDFLRANAPELTAVRGENEPKNGLRYLARLPATERQRMIREARIAVDPEDIDLWDSLPAGDE
jgi:prevent-host-death family protein